jgi:hypothetical protein
VILRVMYDVSRLAADIEESNRYVAETKARREREAVEREEAMLRDLGLMRKALMRADARDRQAVDRAAEGEAREHLMVRLTAASLASGIVAAALAVVALFH